MSVAAEPLVERAMAVARSSPELLVALLVGVLVLVGGGYLLYRLTRPPGVKLASLLAKRDDVSILTHPDPDPDAMAAAMGVASLAEQLDTDATIQFSGQIRHRENRAFRNVMDVDLNRIDGVNDLESGPVILVDHNRARGIAGSDEIRPLAVVDHHPGEGHGESFTDVRSEYGACSSVVAEYFDDLDATPVPPDTHGSEIDSTYTLPSRVATGLHFGILTDTNRLTSGISAADFAAGGFLAGGIDEGLLDRVANPHVSAEVLDIKATAIRERDVEGPFAISDVGDVSNADAIPQAADELVRLEGVTAAVVYGMRNGVLHLSGRSRDDRVHMGRAIDSALDDVPGGNGGGHARMGGGRVQTDDDFGRPGRRAAFTGRLRRALEGDI